MKKTDQNYFRIALIKFLDENQPNMSGDTMLIKNRSKAALKTFRELYRKGIDECVALEMAYNELIDGLHFSLYKYILNLISEDFDEIPIEKRKDFCLSILPECSVLVEKFTYPDDEQDEDLVYHRLETGISEVVMKNIHTQE